MVKREEMIMQQREFGCGAQPNNGTLHGTFASFNIELLKKVFQVYSVILDFWINCFLILPIQASLLALLVVFVFSCSWSLQCASNM